MAPFESRPLRLVLASATVLFAELLLMRWIPANAVHVGFFSNFLLMASFLGMGVGILAGRNGWRPPTGSAGVLVFAAVFLTGRVKLDVLPGSSEEIFLLERTAAAAPSVAVLPLLMLVVVLVMATLARPLGPLLASLAPLRAYALDIVGSLIGTGGFALLAALWTPPVVWFGVLAVLLALLALGEKRGAGSLVGAAAMAGAIALGAGELPQGAVSERWSPYYRVTTYAHADGMRSLNVNGMPHQLWGETARIVAHPNPYDQIYRWFPGRRFDNVLIVGAGNGLDVAVHLGRGAKHIDAVEIDPLIASIGSALHPDRPYADPRVTLTVDDGRSFLRRTAARYDLVVFAAPDSLTLVAGTTGLRVESFLFTKECFETVRDRLAPGGVFVLSNVYWKPWLVQRLARTLAEVFGAPPLARHSSGTDLLTVLADGPLVAALAGGAPPGEGAERVRLDGAPAPATDDWPFPYLRERSLPGHYLVALASFLALSVVLVTVVARRTGLSPSQFSMHFFALGVAFLLLETRSLVTFGLLFGTTWRVNSLAFAAILTSVLLAIGVQAAARPPRALLYALLAAALAASALIGPEDLRVDPAWLRWALAGAVAFAPVFFANLVFARSFADSKAADTAFASNLLGAACGGALEYLSLLVGHRALVAFVAAAYVLAFITERRRAS